MRPCVQADVVIFEKTLAVEIPDKYDIEMGLPYEVDDNASDAAFDRKKGILTLTMPLKTWTEKAYAAARAKAASKAEGDESDTQKNGQEGASNQGVVQQETISYVVKGPGGGVLERGGGKKKEEGDFEKQLKERLQKQSEKGKTLSGGSNKVILGSKEEAELKEKEKKGVVVSDRRPFECERCQWRSVATAVRSCKRCHWCEPGSKEESKMIEEVKEQEKWRASRKQDEVGTVDETGGVEDMDSIRAFRFRSRLAFELDVDEPSWLQGIREKHYGPGDPAPKKSDFKEIPLQ